jgi:hypothetical protein
LANKTKVDPCRSCPYKESEHCSKCIGNPSRRKGKETNPWSGYLISEEEREQLKKEILKSGRVVS